jgi:purine nucleosidase
MSSASHQIPVLLDTDIGSDIDDAVALSYLLRNPRCALIGVTTVTGDVIQRAALVQILHEAYGRHTLPIHCGASTPLLWGPGQPNVPQYEAVKHHPHRLDRRPNTAVEFLQRSIRSRPGQITLLSIGPLTNIAILFALDPEIPSLLARFVSMAGVFYDDPNRLEWNCMVDPIATAIVYAATAKAKIPGGHLSVGLDVTQRCRLSAAEVKARFTPSPLDVVQEMAGSWFQHSWDVTFHDPLAAALIFEPDLCHYESGTIEILVESGKDNTGQTKLITDTEHKPHTVAKHVDVERFFAEYFRVFD